MSRTAERPVFPEWNVVHDRTAIDPEILSKLDALADSTRDAAWDRAFALLDEHPRLLNEPRAESKSGYAPLHQAAWHGADPDVVRRILDRGAWLTLRTTEGETPADIARRRGHEHLVEILEPAADHWVLPDDAADIETYLQALVTVRSRRMGATTLRLPQLGPIVELGHAMWCPIPGMYGGFSLRWDGEAVISSSWSRVSGGSGERHRVSVDGVELLERGFV